MRRLFKNLRMWWRARGRRTQEPAGVELPRARALSAPRFTVQEVRHHHVNAAEAAECGCEDHPRQARAELEINYQVPDPHKCNRCGHHEDQHNSEGVAPGCLGEVLTEDYHHVACRCTKFEPRTDLCECGHPMYLHRQAKPLGFKASTATRSHCPIFVHL